MPSQSPRARLEPPVGSLSSSADRRKNRDHFRPSTSPRHLGYLRPLSPFAVGLKSLQVTPRYFGAGETPRARVQVEAICPIRCPINVR